MPEGIGEWAWAFWCGVATAVVTLAWGVTAGVMQWRRSRSAWKKAVRRERLLAQTRPLVVQPRPVLEVEMTKVERSREIIDGTLVSRRKHDDMDR